MAIQARSCATSATTAAPPPAAALPQLAPPFEALAASPRVTPPSVLAASPRLERLLSMAPLTISIVLSTALFWMPLFRGTAGFILVALTLFLAYWVVRSYMTLFGSLISMRRIGRWARRDWAAEYRAWQAAHPATEGRAAPEAWDWPRHLIVVPNYKEDESGMRRLLQSLTAQAHPEQLVVVLAMEEREAEAQLKATRLLLEFRGRFADSFATYHPAGLVGEVPGKGSNEAWGVRRAYEHLIAGSESELARYTITSCDADSIFAPHHFDAMNYLFLTAKDRYRSFWQPAITNSNNIWDIPAPLRIMEGLGTVNRLANLTFPVTVPFPTSCYTLSWQMLHAVDYWDEEVIPEDWHIFMKCSLTLGDRVRMFSIYVPIGNDCVLADGYVRTLKARYLQTVRHAFGCVDMAYAWRGFWRHESPLSRRRALALAFSMTHVHALWASQWFFVTLGAAVPGWIVGFGIGIPLPAWWAKPLYTLPGLSIHMSAILHPARWFVLGSEGLIDPLMRLSMPGMLVASCLIPLVSLIAIEQIVRGKRPAHIGRGAFARQFLIWPLMAPITLIWGALPAFQAQWRLASGQGLIYKVAEKGTRESVRAAVSPETARALAAVSHAVLFERDDVQQQVVFGRDPYIV